MWLLKTPRIETEAELEGGSDDTFSLHTIQISDKEDHMDTKGTGGKGRQIFLSARHYDGYFTVIASNFHNNLVKHFTDEETKAQISNLPNITQPARGDTIWLQAQSV